MMHRALAEPPPPPETPAVAGWQTALKIAAPFAGAASAYHGYKRNNSAGWAVGWFLFGATLPFLAVPIALAQGYGKPLRGSR
jgi:hypothetical protein